MTLWENSEPRCITISHPTPAGSDASASSNVDSATIYLMKKAASGIPRAWGALWEIIQDLEFDENFAGVVEASKALRSIDGCEEGCSPEAGAQDNEVPPATSDMSAASSSENEGGLLFQSAEFNRDEGSERLDYVITQVDISRMSRAASRQLNVEDVHQLPTIIYSERTPSICSSHDDEEDEEEEGVDEFLLRNRGIIEDYFDTPEDNSSQRQHQTQRPVPTEFSWMMVPPDPENELVRFPDPVVPDSISICKSTDSLSVECSGHDDETFEHCVICNEHFSDGDQLRVLPCQHRFHSGCIDKWLSREIPSNCCIVSGCPMCKRGQSKAPTQQDESEVTQPTRGGGRQPEASRPPWALSTLIPGLRS